MYETRSYDGSRKSTLYDQLLESLLDVEEVQQSKDDTQEAWQQLLSTMSPEHIDILVGEYEALQAARQAGEKYNLGALSLVAGLMVVMHLKQDHYGKDRPLALPKLVADIYLNDPLAFPARECSVCFYRFPVDFEICPLCGSKAAR